MARTHHDIFKAIHIAAINSGRCNALAGVVGPLAAEGMELMAPLTLRPLTLAEQHADELLHLVKGANSSVPTALTGAWHHAANRVLDKIEPKPPTLDEALRALEEIAKHSHDCASVNRTHGVLTRARAAGLL